MELDGYVRDVAQQLTAAAALGDDRVREIAAALATAAAPAVRLAILGALAAAADEITAALLDSPGSPAVAVHLDADDIRIAVSVPVPDSTEPVPPRADDGDASARISLRLSESLKTDIDAAATRDGISVNTWLVRVATAALNGPGPGAPFGRRGSGWDRGANAHHVTGWING